MLTIIIFIFIILILYVTIGRGMYEQKGHWHHSFTNMNPDTSDFYKSVGNLIEESKAPDVSMRLRDYSEGGLFSFKREYLVVSRRNISVFICASPFGNGFFFSYWVKKKVSDWDRIIRSIPFIGKQWYELRQYKMFYHWDTEQMFMDVVHSSVLNAIDEITKAQGIRGLTELERKPNFKTLGK